MFNFLIEWQAFSFFFYKKKNLGIMYYCLPHNFMTLKEQNNSNRMIPLHET